VRLRPRGRLAKTTCFGLGRERFFLFGKRVGLGAAVDRRALRVILALPRRRDCSVLAA
jgi:hypothetical protein